MSKKKSDKYVDGFLFCFIYVLFLLCVFGEIFKNFSGETIFLTAPHLSVIYFLVVAYVIGLPATGLYYYFTKQRKFYKNDAFEWIKDFVCIWLVLLAILGGVSMSIHESNPSYLFLSFYGLFIVGVGFVALIYEKKKPSHKFFHKPSHDFSDKPSHDFLDKPSHASSHKLLYKYKYQCPQCHFIWTEKRIGFYRCPKCHKYNVGRFIKAYPLIIRPNIRVNNGPDGN